MRRWLLPLSGALVVGLAVAVVAARSDVTMTAPASEPISSSAPAEAPISAPPAPEPARTILRAPPVPRAFSPRQAETPRADLVATAYYLDAPIFERPDQEPETLGILRRGRSLAVEARAYGPGCSAGAWYRVGLGVVCTQHGFMVSSVAQERAQRHAAPESALPYRYASVARGRGALRLHREPKPSEREKLEALRLDARAEHPPVVDLRMEGDYFVALDAEPEAALAGWVRTVRGRYVHADDLVPTPTSRLVGSALDGELSLPLAFVYGEDRPLLRIENDQVTETGLAETYARVAVRSRATIEGVRYVVDDEGQALRRDHVRLAQRIPRPERVPPDTRWLHVDLHEQTLVAYEGDRPVYATLVSTGREGYETPRGTFRVRDKYVGTTMRGEDPVDGPYEVEEVPWTQYYWRSYAIHGAYWHDAFGQVRSHGCTNLAPADARHLFEWTSPKVPEAWHARRLRAGTHLHFTR